MTLSTGYLEALADPECGWFYRCCTEDFQVIPGQPIAYWSSKKIQNVFEKCPEFDSSLAFREGIHTANNDYFLRFWWEPSKSDVVEGAKSLEDVDAKGKWVPYNKGGNYRKWYGNNEYLIGFSSTFREKMKKLKGCVWPSQSLWFKEGGTWTAISTGQLGVRYYPEGFLFDAGGQVLVGSGCIEAIAALNSSLYSVIAELTMPTLNYKCGVIKTLPDIRTGEKETEIIAQNCIQLSMHDWDSVESSSHFKKHPLIG